MDLPSTLFADMFSEFGSMPSVDIDDISDLFDIDDDIDDDIDYEFIDGVLEDITGNITGNITEHIPSCDINIVDGIPCDIVIGTAVCFLVEGLVVIETLPPIGAIQDAIFDYVPEPPLKSKNTHIDALCDVEENIIEAIAQGDAAALMREDYVLFGGRDAAVASTCREIDRNKDVALVLKMVSARYNIPLCQVYGDFARITCAVCVTCDTHKPQRGSLLCYYCAKKNKKTFATLVQQYMEKNKV